MFGAKHGASDLIQMQSLPLEQKVAMSESRIRQWYDAFWGDVFVSFSGGKDSTVLLDRQTRLEDNRIEKSLRTYAELGLL
ncbi:MAG: hypothetical protein LUI61_06505 [Firmicutes bacterium]|nr:hypothetical protein [Bacillota bacterium]